MDLGLAEERSMLRLLFGSLLVLVVPLAGCIDSSSLLSKIQPLKVQVSGSLVTVSPADEVSVRYRERASFSVTADAGFSVPALVGGSCATGTWDGNVYTTGVIEDDCEISFTGNWLHSKTLGVTGATVGALGSAVDQSGNLYVVGNSSGSLPGNTLIGTGDVYLAKYSASGVLQWIRQTGVAGASTIPRSIVMSDAGEIFIAGSTTGNLDGETRTGTTDSFLMKYDANGVKQWTKLFGASSASSTAYKLRLDSSSNLYVIGTTNGDFDGHTKAGVTDIFVMKFSSAGVKQWSRQFGGATADAVASGLAVNSDGALYVSGYTNAALDGQSLAGVRDVFLVKYDTDGNRVWTKLFGVSGAELRSYGVSLDSNGYLYIAGYSTGSYDGNTRAGNRDALLIKCDSDGNKIWSRQLGVSGVNTVFNNVEIDSDGQLYLIGYTGGGLDGNTLMGTLDVILIKYDSNGAKQWSRQAGGSGGTSTGLSLSFDPYKNIYALGNTGASTFDGNSRIGSTDAFLMKFNPLGEKQ